MAEEPPPQKSEDPTVAHLRKTHSIPDSISSENIATPINAMQKASDWVLDQVSNDDLKAANVGDHIEFMFSQTRADGILGDEFVNISDSGEITAAIHKDALTRLDQQPEDRNTPWLMYKGDSEVFGDKYLTTDEYFESMGVEATVHYLQAKKIKGFESVPESTPNPAGFKGMFGQKYDDQTHEFQALEYKYRFFEEKYQGTDKTNPYKAKWQRAQMRKRLNERDRPRI